MLFDTENPPMFLSIKEVQEFTGYKRQAEQKRWLEGRGYPFTVNAEGRIIMLRAYVEQMLGAPPAPRTKRQKTIGPNWDAVNA